MRADEQEREDEGDGGTCTHFSSMEFAALTHGTMNNFPENGSLTFVPDPFPLTSRRVRELGSNGL